VKRRKFCFTRKSRAVFIRLNVLSCDCVYECSNVLVVSDSDTASLSPASYIGLLDRTRMFLCVFMMTLFIFNPFTAIVKLGRGIPTVSADNTGRSAGRTLLNADDTEPGLSVSVCVCLSVCHTVVTLSFSLPHNSSPTPAIL